MTRICLLVLALLCLGADIAFGEEAPPPTLDVLLHAEMPEAEGADEGAPGSSPGFAGEARLSAMRAAALTLGSRAALARRGWEIAGMLERHGRMLSTVYRFRDLVIRRSGFTVMPPVLAETDRAFRLGRDGARAASARRVIRIVEPERIVSAVPHWRDYLVREWPQAGVPAAVLHPRGEVEARHWRSWLREGWVQGRALADDIFAADLERLNRTFTGLVLWHRASLAGMVSAPSLETTHTASSGHGRLVRIDEIRAALGPAARFELRPQQWKALPYTPAGERTSANGDTPAGGRTPAGGATP